MGNNKGGHPRKQKRNTTGLKNQQNISAPQKTTQQPTENPDIPEEGESSSNHWIPEDSICAAEYFEYETCDDSEDEEEDLKQGEWDNEVLEDENLQDALLRYAAAMDDEIYDESWVPEDLLAERLRKRKQQCQEHEHKECAKTYATGPDIAQKSARSQRPHRNKTIGQNVLGKYGFTGGDCTVLGFSTQEDPVPSTDCSSSSPCILSTPDESVEPVLTWDGDEPLNLNHSDVTASQCEEFVEESWEDELDERAGLDKAEIRSWNELREQIKQELRIAKKKGLPLSQVNQLHNFATLHLKGMGRMKASQEIALQ
ncbi:hypothetical protein BT96DRAFT_991371 [Gymnopus androsaceus JB14]|uniref:Uncharacterized protein n=1 Tax=Gymnopus androsaceus JB14 TaxID=1447944 RepID=A0A6A4HWA8_9AGAR|nr:hypothetical protein BT96DRAFT_991371 [Gymnopus androsaceus JB14]